MPRGGYRQPDPKTPPGGPGKFSRRTDGAQPVRTPPLAGSPDLQYGDVGKMQAAQQIAPIPDRSAPAPGGAAPAPGGGPLGGGGTGLPSFLTDMASARPQEPVTAGLGVGAGPGPEALANQPAPQDDQEAVLEYLVRVYSNAEAAQMLNDKRMARTQPPAGGTVAPPNLEGPGTAAPPMQ